MFSGEKPTKKRITARKRGEKRGICLFVPSTLAELTQVLTKKLSLKVDSLYTESGGLIDSIELIRDNDIVEVEINNKEDKLSNLQETTKADNDWITLNVGGVKFMTTRTTLASREPESMFGCMFQHDRPFTWKSTTDDSNAFLIDRSPKYFEPILNYLRHGQLIFDDGLSIEGVLEEARFYNIVSLVEILEKKVQEERKTEFQITRELFCKRLLATQSNVELRCQGMNFEGCDLSRLDLKRINFRYANLKNSNLEGANFAFCDMERANLSGAQLDGAALMGARMLCINLEGACMRGCNLEEPNGQRTNLEGANLKGVNLSGSSLAGANLRVAKLKKADLRNCDLRGAVLAGADLESCDLSGCDLQEANLRGANLKDAIFELMISPLHMSQAL
ncbi:DgyrCDS1727 [Dimorphilus gyrociliatus]|uniref:DgyrCDS1727 n=1 Tax=Dimorphilus gyrociliatus TaxID=2664684 RepID=A0A7I8VAA8_9ANNE|nr:DgyrCDS1727 [Dimorphilus gyrociliatus]